MKRPRIEDIDATAAIDPSWDKMPRIEKPPKQAVRLPLSDTPPNLHNEPSPIAYARTDVRPRRVLKRHAFEIYQDQLDELRRFADLDRHIGGTGNMSEMVRGALDRLIAERKQKEGSE
jgi:hypothetical protein